MKMILVGYVVPGNACAVSWKKPEGERPFGRPRIRWGLILKWVLNIAMEI
jgi:hypothetical protein